MSDDLTWLIDLPTCPSTNTWALEHCAALAHGACVYTAAQTAGRGRDAKAWISPPGVLTATFIVQLADQVPVTQLALTAGLAVVHAIDDLAPRTPARIKWPNDCYMDGRKVAGILCERPSGSDRVIVGIGLNVDPQWDQLPAGLLLNSDARQAPASIAEFVNDVPAPHALLIAIRRYLLEATGLLAAGGWPRLLPHLRQRDHLAGRRLTTRSGDRQLSGIGAGLDDAGRLLLRDHDGMLQALGSGEVLSIA